MFNRKQYETVMSTGERQREIIRILLGRRFETMQNLAAEIGVSDRTIRRDVLNLTTAYPLETVLGKFGGVKLPGWYNPHRNLLSRERQEALTRAINAMDADTAKLLREILTEFGGQAS
jgi:DeoR/GlpR family transcriptional regulator of sugar metabolism